MRTVRLCINCPFVCPKYFYQNDHKKVMFADAESNADDWGNSGPSNYGSRGGGSSDYGSRGGGGGGRSYGDSGSGMRRVRTFFMAPLGMIFRSE
jgi:hypothetical protein